MLDRLSALDASFLQTEQRSHRMHLLGVFVFAGPPPSPAEFAEAIDRRLPAVPRFRQRVLRVPLDIGRPVWIDDAGFELTNHVHQTTLAAPGEREQLRELAAQMLAEPLDMARPGWELTLVTGLADDHFAVVGKFHHCMVDGVSAMDITAKLFAGDPDEPPPARVHWRPRPRPSALRLLTDAVTDTVLNPVETTVADRVRLRDPLRLAAQAATAGGALADMARRGGSAPVTRLNAGPCGPARDVHWISVRLDELRAVKSAFATTINNVVLATVAGGLARWLERHGDSREAMRAMVPVSLRVEGDRGELGNRITTLYVRLPVECDDARERVARVAAELERARGSLQPVGARALAEIGEFAPPTIMAQAARLHYRARLFNIAVTNVPGPRAPLYLLGRPMLEVLPTAPVTPQHGLNVAVVSYLDRLEFALTADRARVPDLAALAGDVRAAYAETRNAALPRTRRTQRTAPSRRPVRNAQALPTVRVEAARP